MHFYFPVQNLCKVLICNRRETSCIKSYNIGGNKHYDVNINNKIIKINKNINYMNINDANFQFQPGPSAILDSIYSKSQSTSNLFLRYHILVQRLLEMYFKVQRKNSIHEPEDEMEISIRKVHHQHVSEPKYSFKRLKDPEL